jgi:hypothetical protein
LANSGCKSNGADKNSLDKGMKNQTASAIRTDRENEIFETVSLVIRFMIFQFIGLAQ